MAIQIVGPAAAALGAAGVANASASMLNSLKGSKTDSGSSKSSTSSAKSISHSNTYGNMASERSLQYAREATASANSAWDKAAQWNAEQAEISRRWSEYMSSTQYQRAVEDMRKAGLNPILAAQNGISSGSVASGATASMSAPETYMGQSIAEQNSASSSRSHSESSGSSWSHSESGLATGLGLLADSLKNLQGGMNSAVTVENYINDLEKEGKKVGNKVKETAKTTKEEIKKAAQKVDSKLNPRHVYNTSNDHSGGGTKFGKSKFEQWREKAKSRSKNLLFGKKKG